MAKKELTPEEIVAAAEKIAAAREASMTKIADDEAAQRQKDYEDMLAKEVADSEARQKHWDETTAVPHRMVDDVPVALTQDEIDEIEAERQEWLGSKAIVREIAELEAQQTPRRMREAQLGTDNGWLANLDAQIKTLRNKLNKK